MERQRNVKYLGTVKLMLKIKNNSLEKNSLGMQIYLVKGEICVSFIFYYAFLIEINTFFHSSPSNSFHILQCAHNILMCT